MAYGRVSMRKTREILRLKFEARLSHRQIGRACGVSCSTVSEAVGRFQAAGLSWPLPAELPDSALEARLYRAHGVVARDTREPDWQHVRKELAREHVTLAALWGEYKLARPDGYQYSWFCAAYRTWAGKIDVVMRFPHKAGEKLFVDSRRGHRAARRSGKRRGAPRLPLRGRARGLELHLRRGRREPGQ